MNQELLKKAEELKLKRDQLINDAMKLQGEMEKVKAEEKATFGICEGDKITIPDLIVLMAKLQ